MDQELKGRARRQFGASGDAYVVSKTHAGGADLDRMVELATPAATDRLLDVATGGGHVARVFAPHVAAVIASDLTPAMLERAAAFLRDQGLTNVTFQEADAEAMPFPDEAFDILTCRIAPHHFPRPDRFVQEAARVLKPGGRFLLIDTTPPEGEPGVVFNRFERLRDPSHVRSLTTAEWTRVIAAAGLDLRAVEPFPKRHDFVDWTARAHMTDEGRSDLVATILAAGPEIHAAYNIERSDGELIAFTDVKTLFLAVRAT